MRTGGVAELAASRAGLTSPPTASGVLARVVLRIAEGAEGYVEITAKVRFTDAAFDIVDLPGTAAWIGVRPR
jgi:hypothetical protein